MRIINFIVAFCFLVFTSCNNKSNKIFADISKNISTEAVKKNYRKSKTDFYRKVRNQLNKEVDLDKLLNSDKIFLLESYRYENGVTYGLIWSEKDTVPYTYFQDKIERQSFENNYFGTDMINLISNWDLSSIKSKQAIYPEQVIYASKVIKEEQLKIEHETFMMF